MDFLNFQSLDLIGLTFKLQEIVQNKRQISTSYFKQI